MSESRWLAVAVCLAMLTGCSDDARRPWIPDGPLRGDSGAPFLAQCEKDSDCTSGRCADLGGKKGCTRRCDTTTPCPALQGWTCGSASLCECRVTGKQPTVCNVDGDCDGQPDRKVQTEVCNGEDDDCNGVVDDVAPGAQGATQYYRDADGDGYGDLASYRWLCQPEAGWVTSSMDCDDGRKDRNPGMTEVCGDGVDHDCDGKKDDADICGLVPILVQDVNDPQSLSSTIKTCGSSSTTDPSLDIVDIVAKQDHDVIKYTVRLAGSPALATCASYTLHLGTFTKSYEMVYIYRPAKTACAGLAETAVYQKGQPVSSAATMTFNAADPGHVAFTIPKTEYFPSLSTPTYYLKACTNAKADAVGDLTQCTADSCETPVHR